MFRRAWLGWFPSSNRQAGRGEGSRDRPAMSFASFWKTGSRRHALGYLLLASIAWLLGNFARAADFNPRDLAILDRLTWGVTASSAEHFRSVGLERWLAEQLHPPGN